MTQVRQSRVRTPARFGLPEGWWPVAHGHEVRQHPGAFRLGRQSLAIYRDLSGVARAVDDRCPHRRLPLSMGRLTEDGSIQCPYHGWSFDGATGRCTAIPNLSEGERIPNGMRVTAFSALETFSEAIGYGLRTSILAPAVEPTGEEPDDGTTMFDAALVSDMVFIWTGAQAPTARPAEGPKREANSATSGTADVRSPYQQLAEAFLVNPGAALGLGALIGAGDEQCSPVVRVHGSGPETTIEVIRQRLAYDLPRASTFESVSKRVVTSRITASVTTGLTRVECEGGRWQPRCHITIGLTPVGDFQTQVRWQVHLHDNGRRPVRLGTRIWSSARNRSGRATAVIERLADSMEITADEAVTVLRTARTAIDN